MLGWTADFFRFWWAAAYWNARKSWFRLTGAHRDSCPCQAHGDSGLALDARCRAMIGWRAPRRFRAVCPNLTATAKGWRCGVDAERVRPFWPRALLAYGGAVATIYLLVTVAIYVRLHRAEPSLDYAAVLLPHRWPELRLANSARYVRLADQALGAGNRAAAITALERARRLNPADHAAALRLAALFNVTAQPAAARLVFETLMHDRPDQRPATARAWLPSLAASGDHDGVKRLATAMLTEDSAHRDLWLDALVRAARSSRDSHVLAAVADGELGLPQWCVEIAAIERLLLSAHPEQAAPRLARVFTREHPPLLPAYQADRLLAEGRRDAVEPLLAGYLNRVNPVDATLLRWRAAGSPAPSSTDGQALLATLPRPLDAASATRVAAACLRRDGGSLSALLLAPGAVADEALAENAPSLRSGLLLIALLSGQRADAELQARELQRDPQANITGLRELADALSSRTDDATVSRLLATQSLPIEVIYAARERAEAGAIVMTRLP